MRYRYYTADVFTDKPFGGNPLAVFTDPGELSPELMQSAAKELNLSETVFVFPPDDPGNTRRLRIFTPGSELAFAGHPTVGTAHVLASIGAIQLEGKETRIVFEEGVGPVPVTLWAEEGKPVFAQLSAALMPEYGPPPPPAADIAAVLSLAVDDLDSSAPPQALSCGLPYLCVQLRDRAAVTRARLRIDEWERVLASYWAPFIYFYALDPELPGSDVHARMFAPGVGVPEDPATGSAATVLAGLLAARAARASVCEGSFKWVIEQGFEMGRPSLIAAEADVQGGAVVAIRVGGPSVLMTEGWMEI